MAIWIVGYVTLMRYFVPRAQRALPAPTRMTRSIMVGRIVDSYTNILTVKLFARGEAERSAVREAIDRSNQTFLAVLRLITGVDRDPCSHEQPALSRSRRSPAGSGRAA